ncbi:transcriptional regulator [Actinobacillus seminis]|uniref:Transcriptional regulator n=1 Tax=Actinobacillus seminis TaxID=722 RepID=A0ABX4FNX2_9PAST|nr:transcriptional regulator [Actinobacillus seminis]
MGSKAKIKRMISSGKLPSYKFGRSRLISEIDLVNYIKSCQK